MPRSAPHRHRSLGRRLHPVCRAVGHRRGRLRQQLPPSGHGVAAGLRSAQGALPAAVGRHRQCRVRGPPGPRSGRRQPAADRAGSRGDQEVTRGARRRRPVRTRRSRLQGRHDHVRPDPVPQGRRRRRCQEGQDDGRGHARARWQGRGPGGAGRGHHPLQILLSLI